MKDICKIIVNIFIITVGILCFNNCNKEKSNPQPASHFVVDDIGEKVKFDSIPLRVITLAPNLTEMIYELELEKYLIGNTLYCNYPEAASRITKVGDILTIDFEKVIELNPDLFIITVEGNNKETYNKLRELGFKVFVSNPRNFEGIKKTFKDLGMIFHLENKVKKIINKWNSEVGKVTSHAGSYKGKTAMILIELTPLMLAGKNTFLNEFIELCGLENIAADSPVNYPIFNREEILTRNPDYIVYPSGGEKNLDLLIHTYPEWADLQAVMNGNVLFVDRDLYSRPGPRFVDALLDLHSRLQSKME